MSVSGPPNWGPDDTGSVPIGPEPEPTGAAGGGEGPGGWGGKPRVEPFAIAALVWAVVSIVLPIVGTIVALVLSTRAADAIRRSQGTRTGAQLVTAARVTAGAVIALWAIGLIAFVAFGGTEDNGNKVAVPTQPSTTNTTTPTTSTTQRPTTSSVSTTRPATTTTRVAPPTVITVAPPPTSAAPTTAPPTTAPPTTAPPTTASTAPPTVPPTSPTTPSTQPAPPTTTTPASTTTTAAPSPGEQEARRLERTLLRPRQLGPSNRGVPNSERVVVQYTPGATVTVTWAINNGTPPLPTGTPTCAPLPSTTTTTSTSSTTSSTTTTTTSSSTTTSTTVAPGTSTSEVARQEAVKILRAIRSDMSDGRLDVTGIQLVGTYPIQGPGTADVDVVQVFYTATTIQSGVPTAAKVFDAPPAADVQCLNPAFA